MRSVGSQTTECSACTLVCSSPFRSPLAHLHRSENASRVGATPASAAPRIRLKRGVRRLRLSHHLAPAPVSSTRIYIHTYTRTYCRIHTYTHHISNSILLFHSCRSRRPFSVRSMHALSVLPAASHKSSGAGAGRGFPLKACSTPKKETLAGEKATRGKRKKGKRARQADGSGEKKIERDGFGEGRRREKREAEARQLTGRARSSRERVQQRTWQRKRVRHARGGRHFAGERGNESPHPLSLHSPLPSLSPYRQCLLAPIPPLPSCHSSPLSVSRFLSLSPSLPLFLFVCMVKYCIIVLTAGRKTA